MPYCCREILAREVVDRHDTAGALLMRLAESIVGEKHLICTTMHGVDIIMLTIIPILHYPLLTSLLGHN